MSIKRTVAIVMMAAAGPAVAQQAPTDAKPAAPATPPAAAPAAQAPPAAGAPAAQPPAPAAEAPAAAAPAPKADAAKEALPKGTQLPPVQVIQEKPKPAPAPKQEAAPAPKKKPAVAEPAPEPAAAPAPKKKVAAPAPAPKAAPAAAPKAAPAPVAAAPAPAEPAPEAPSAPAGSVEADYVKMSPVGGSEIPIEKVPGGVAAVKAADLARPSAGTAQEILQQRVPGIIISDLQGNGVQQDVQYRGFTSSPLPGLPQGIAVYQNGVRINEVWGDTVNWEMIPSNAIADVTVMSNNPAYGLNAIGGAISIGLKDGFTYQGAEIDGRIGSFGRRQIGLQAGQKVGNFAAYAAVEALHDDGWRDFSRTNLKRMYADVGAKNDVAELHVNFTGAISRFGATAAAPVELLDARWASTFTSPQTTRTEMEMVSINGAVVVTPTLKLSGVGYMRRFNQRRIDGNIVEIDNDCNDGILNGGNDFLCTDANDPSNTAVEDRAGNVVGADILNGAPIGSLDRTQTEADSYGGSVQAVEKSKIFGLGNQFLVGGSMDHGKVKFNSSAELGTIGPKFVVAGTGIEISEPDDFAARWVVAKTHYYGLFFSDTLDLTDKLSITAGGRYNVAHIELEDRTGNFSDLTGNHRFSRFNPMVGATYKVMPGLSVYGGYSEANRAPTPIELACSDPDKPCVIESFLTADPPLEQVVSNTYEAGLRGDLGKGGGQRLEWSLGYFRTLNKNDIIDVASPTTGRGYFTNAGDTLRQGLEVALNYRNDRFSTYANYSFVDATFRDALELSSPNNPNGVPCTADANQNCINVKPGDHLASIPAHRFKAGFDYWLTSKWKAGADVIVTSDQFFRGDESNQNAKLDGYQRVDLHTSYDITPNLQIYGLVQNLFDKKYGLYGTYFELDAANGATSATGASFTDARTITPAAPFGAYGGMKLKF